MPQPKPPVITKEDLLGCIAAQANFDWVSKNSITIDGQLNLKELAANINTLIKSAHGGT